MKSVFGDKRLDHRLARLVHDLSGKPHSQLPQVLTEWSQLKGAIVF
jgi:hypothetical protein